MRNTTPEERTALFYEAAKRIDYDAEAGLFFWSRNDLNETRFQGKEAGYVRVDGYHYIQIKGDRLLSHRLAWLIVNGNLPRGQIDHKNMNRSDNRIANLREATYAENNRNRGVQANNTTGFKGVTLCRKTRKYHAKICRDGEVIALGTFPTAEKASLAYQGAVKEHHGDFARFQ